jgi:hypothetical protein
LPDADIRDDGERREHIGPLLDGVDCRARRQRTSSALNGWWVLAV